MSIGKGNTCSLDNPLAASTNHWTRQHAAPAPTEIGCTESREHFFEPKAGPELDPKSNDASPNNPFARSPTIPRGPPAEAASQEAAPAIDPNASRPDSPFAPAPRIPQRAPEVSSGSAREWSPAQVAAWATELGFPAAASEAILELGVDGATLSGIVSSQDQEALIELGVGSRIQRHKLMASWQALISGSESPTRSGGPKGISGAVLDATEHLSDSKAPKCKEFEGYATVAKRVQATSHDDSNDEPGCVVGGSATLGQQRASDNRELNQATVVRPAARVNDSSRTRANDLQVLKYSHGGNEQASMPTDGEARQLFKAIDSNNDGFITPAELSCRLADAGWPDANIMTLFLDIDKNLDGKISGAEFEKAWKQNLFTRHSEGRGSGGESQQLLTKLRDKVYQKWRGLRDAFRACDEDHNQAISVTEFCELLHRFQFDLNPQEIRKLVILFDRNNDGVISYLEFVAVVEGRTPMPEAAIENNPEGAEVVLTKVKQRMFHTFDNLRSAFLKYDHDKSGALDARELNAVMESSGLCIEPGQLAELVQTFDTNGDGQIQYNEFVRAMQ